MLLSLALAFLCAMILGWVMQRLHLPALLGMLLTGVLLGPYAANLLDASILGISSQLRQIALIIVLTRAGLGMDFGALKRVGRPAVLLCFVPACFEIAGTVLLAPVLLGLSVVESAVLGAVIAAVSPAVVVPKMLRLTQEKRGTDKGIPQLIMAGASVDDVFCHCFIYGIYGYGRRAKLFRTAAFADSDFHFAGCCSRDAVRPCAGRLFYRAPHA